VDLHSPPARRQADVESCEEDLKMMEMMNLEEGRRYNVKQRNEVVSLRTVM